MTTTTTMTAMHKLFQSIFLPILLVLISSCGVTTNSTVDSQLASTILADSTLVKVHQKAYDLVATGFNAGTVYQEVWIRDYNTFIEVSCEVLPLDQVRENLLTFFKFQGPEGDIIDGFVPIEQATVGYKYRYSEQASAFAGHKNTVETDQESSLVQAVFKYIIKTEDQSILDQVIDGKTVLERLDFAMTYLMNHRYDQNFGLLWGATTVDWGDVQPEHEWGVELDENSHLCIDIYDNAMFTIALDHLLVFLTDEDRKDYWTKVRDMIMYNLRMVLWDPAESKYLPHLYIDGSPFPEDFEEDQIHYHGGTAIAIEAGLLSRDEIAAVNTQMLANVAASGAPSIGLTVYPPYPEGYFKNKSMYPYGYQNGGDWTWFGARMIRQLARNGFVQEAYDELKPMVDRVLKYQGFYEWYTVEGKPTGAGKFRGSAGVLATAIEELWLWAEQELTPAAEENTGT